MNPGDEPAAMAPLEAEGRPLPVPGAPADGSPRRSEGPRPASVARIPYLNVAPFQLDWERIEVLSGGRWTQATLAPRQLGLAAESGRIDAGLLAVADLIRLERAFEPLFVPSSGAPVSFGIANRDRVESVLLFLRRELASPGRTPAGPEARRKAEAEAGIPDAGGAVRAAIGDPARPGEVPDAGPARALLDPEEARGLDRGIVGITGETSTSFRLLRLLLEVRHGVRPAYARMDLAGPGFPDIKAALVIGDQALRWKRRPPPEFVLAVDLAAEWHDWTGLPFVFARWGVRRTLPDARKDWLGRFLEASLARSEGRFDELVAGLPEELGEPADLARYLRNFTYRLGSEELLGAERFRALLAEHGIACSGE